MHKHSVTCFSQFDSSKREISPLPPLNTVLEGSIQLFAALRFIPHLQHWLSKRFKKEADGGKRQEKCIAVGEGRAWMLRQLLECGGCWKGKEEKGKGAGTANHLHTRWGVRQAR